MKKLTYFSLLRPKNAEPGSAKTWQVAQRLIPSVTQSSECTLIDDYAEDGRPVEV